MEIRRAGGDLEVARFRGGDVFFDDAARVPFRFVARALLVGSGSMPAKASSRIERKSAKARSSAALRSAKMSTEGASPKSKYIPSSKSDVKSSTSGGTCAVDFRL